MTQDATPTPAVVRRLDSTAAVAMANLAAIFEDLQTTLRCCERLVSELASGDAGPDDLVLEGLDVKDGYAIGVEIVRRALSEPTYLIAANAGYAGHEVLAQVANLDVDDGFDALEGRYGNMIEMGRASCRERVSECV